MNIRAKLIWSALAALFAGGSAQAQSWDAVTGFSYTNNPNGAWQYGYGVTGTDDFTSYSESAQYNWRSAAGWRGSDNPLVAINTGKPFTDFNTVLFQTNMLLLHSGPSAGQDAIVQWTAPAAGLYQISANFQVLDSVNYFGDKVSIYAGGTNLFAQTLGPGAGADLGALTPGIGTSYTDKVSLKAGEVLSFGEALNTDYGWNLVGLNAQITRVSGVPEVGANGSLAALVVVFAFGALVSERRGRA